MRSNLPKREYIREAEEILTRLFKRLNRPEPEAIIHISDKKFFQVPQNFGLNSNTDDIVVMSDHITATSCNNGPELAEIIMGSILKPNKSCSLRSLGGMSAINFRWRYLKYLFNRQDESDPLFQSAVDLNLLLKEIGELRFLTEKYSDMNREKYLNMNEQERKAYDTAQKRMHGPNNNVDEKAAKYLFYESPRKEENMRTFFDYFTAESKEDYLELVEKIVREELGHDRS
jgi:hypothetical protein